MILQCDQEETFAGKMEHLIVHACASHWLGGALEKNVMSVNVNTYSTL